MSPSTARRCSLSPRHSSRQPSLARAVPDRRRMRQYRCGQEGTKASTRRDADATRDARRRCAPRRPRPRTRSGRAGRATRTHVSRSSRRNRSDGPRSHVTPARMRSCARCRSRAARDSRSIVSSSPCAWHPELGSHQGRTGITNATPCGDPRALRSGVVTRIAHWSTPSSRLDDGSARRRPLNVHRALQPVDSGLNQYPTALWLPAVTAGSTPWTASHARSRTPDGPRRDDLRIGGRPRTTPHRSTAIHQGARWQWRVSWRLAVLGGCRLGSAEVLL